MPWYEDWFGSEAYALVYGHRDEDEAERMIDLVEALAAPAEGARILDVGCGRGRHSRALARRGYDVTGIDLSADAIAVARAQAEAEGLDVTFRAQDMREPVCAGCFDGVVNLFTTFGYFDAWREHERALRAMVTALRPGGWLVQDFLNAPYVRRHLVPDDRRTAGGVVIRQRRRIEGGRINKTITLRRPPAHAASGDGNGLPDDPNAPREAVFRESVALLDLGDFRALYDAVGLDLVDVRGDYDGAPHGPDAPRLILHGVRRG